MLPLSNHGPSTMVPIREPKNKSVILQQRLRFLFHKIWSGGKGEPSSCQSDFILHGLQEK